MLTTYRRVLGLPGALAFSLSGLVARLPISMVSLGIVILVSTRTGSYALAGTVSAAFLITNAVCAVLQARLIDRRGQSRVLPYAVGLFAGGLALMMLCVELDLPAPWPHLFAAASGAAMPQIGSCVRARWTHLVPDKQQLQTAFAFEAVVDESVFMLGPVLVTVLSTAVHPLAGLAAAILSAVSGTAALASQRSTEPPVRDPDRPGQTAMPWPVLVPLTVCGLAMGVLFGGAEVATVAFADEEGAKGLSGLLLAVWALGSLLSGLVTGAVHLRASNAARFRWGILSMGLVMIPLPFVEGFVLLSVVLFLAGFAISPTLIASAAWIEEIVPADRLTEALTVFTTGLGAGIAPGAALVGVVVDARGASVSYWVCAVAGLTGALVAFVTARVASPGRPSPTGSSASEPLR
jgi:MFS family permease